MTMTAPAKTPLRCQTCRKVIMEVTGLVEVKQSGIGISRKCKCGVQNDWRVLPEPEPRVKRYCKTT